MIESIARALALENIKGYNAGYLTAVGTSKKRKRQLLSVKFNNQVEGLYKKYIPIATKLLEDKK